jgi:hypothetical protein
MPRKAVHATPGPVLPAVEAERRLLIGEFVFIGIHEAGAAKRLTTTRRTLLHAAARVMDASYGGVAIPAGQVDDPALASPLGAPTDGLEKPATNGDRVR